MHQTTMSGKCESRVGRDPSRRSARGADVTQVTLQIVRAGATADQVTGAVSDVRHGLVRFHARITPRFDPLVRGRSGVSIADDRRERFVMKALRSDSTGIISPKQHAWLDYLVAGTFL